MVGFLLVHSPLLIHCRRCLPYYSSSVCEAYRACEGDPHRLDLQLRTIRQDVVSDQTLFVTRPVFHKPGCLKALTFPALGSKSMTCAYPRWKIHHRPNKLCASVRWHAYVAIGLSLCRHADPRSGRCGSTP